MKTTGIRSIIITISLCAFTSATASFIFNGDFESGNSGFTSDYEYTSSYLGLASGGENPPNTGEGKYAVGTNPKYFHSAFVQTGDHTTGNGNMLIVNGSQNASKAVWKGTVTPPLSVGSMYQFSAWVMNVYPSAPANLRFSFGGNVLGTITPTGNGVWQQFTATFVATTDQSTGLIDLNLVAFGNDFAVDDISLVAVPEPTTLIAGALLLLPFGASMIRQFRRKN